MTDITELAAVLRLAAESEIAYRAEGDTSDLWQDEASPDNVLALVEALEKAQATIIELQQKCEIDPRTHEIIDLKEHIDELEPRTVRLPAACADDEYFNDGVFQPMRYERDVERALRAAGIKWEAE